jgi:hypothetical protein
VRWLFNIVDEVSVCLIFQNEIARISQDVIIAIASYSLFVKVFHDRTQVGPVNVGLGPIHGRSDGVESLDAVAEYAMMRVEQEGILKERVYCNLSLRNFNLRGMPSNERKAREVRIRSF